MSDVTARTHRVSSPAGPTTPASGLFRVRRHALLAVLLLLGAGLVPAYAASAASSSATRLSGFSTTRASVRVGGELWQTVTVAPRTARAVTVQYRRAGTSTFTTASTGRTTSLGVSTLGLKPPAAGTWQFRAVVPATRQASGLVSPTRTVVAVGRASRTTMNGFATTTTAVTVGAAVAADVVIAPGGSRTVSVQSRRPGAAGYLTETVGVSSGAGAFHAVFRPTTVGEWGFRLVVRTGRTALALVSPTRIITAVAASAPGPVTTASGPVTTTSGPVAIPPGPVTIPPGPVAGAPDPVAALKATVITRTTVELAWTNPPAPDLAGVVIRRAPGATAPATATAGSAVTDVAAPGNSFTDTGLDAGTTYSYALFAHDGSPHYAAAAELTVTTRTPATNALLTIKAQGRPNSRPTDRLTVDVPFDFGAGDSLAADGTTLVSGTLDYGDGETFAFTDPFGPVDFWNTFHAYSTTGLKTVTLTVTDSAGSTDTTSTSVRVVDAPTASISVTSGPPQVGSPVTLALGAGTPGDTRLDHYFLMVTGPDHFFVHGATAPPSTQDLTFGFPGTYTVTFCADNDAGGESVATVSVDVAP